MVKIKIKRNSKIYQKGLSLIEVVVCVAIFSILSVSIYGAFTSILNGITYYREKTTISSLADQYIEIVRNMPYSQIGTIEGNPHGTLADVPNAINIIVNGMAYQVYYAVSYIDDSADGTIMAGTDSNPNDYKQIKLYIKNVNTGATNSFLTNVAPKGLEGLDSGGALSIEVFNAVGQPVPGATIHIKNSNIVPNIDLIRTADANGNWIEVGLPNSANSYNIVVSKNDYSVDQTYPISTQNPNPTKPDATILNGQVTQISFSIDQLSNLVFNTLNQTCVPVAAVGLEVHGSKLIGTPNILKFDNIYTSNFNGKIPLNNIEWDSYTPSLAGSNYMIYGSSPIQQVDILPNSSQNFNLIVGPKTANSLLTIVKDASTGNPIEGAEVNLQAISEGYNNTGFTGGSIWSQYDWSGGLGQADFIDSTKYYQDDGNIDSNSIPSGLRLAKISSFYVSSGLLTSSTFDTGTSLTSYTTLTWQPTSQDPATSIKFQIATNNDNLTWNYLGPDGTDQTYYSVSGTTINNANSKRYIRYRVFLSTTDMSKTPVLTSININYVSGCVSPGQVMFSELQANPEYQAIITMNGYQTQTINNINIDGYNVLQVLLSH
jgi:prepilin-type N-terminal cleavage/methylation domain-containing protein